MKCAFAVLAFASPAFAALKELWWNITYVEGASADGLAERRVVGINGAWRYVQTRALRVVRATTGVLSIVLL